MKRWMRFPLLAAVLLWSVQACDSGSGDSGLGEDNTVPVEDILTGDDAGVPQQDTVAPPEDTVAPPEDTVVPPEDTVVPPEDTVVPPEDTVVPPEDTVTPPDPPKLTSGNHPGWDKPKCWTCHDGDNHNTGLDPYQCVACHGTNGAPGGHSNSDNCTGCHGDKHGAEGFPNPISCKTCHPN